MKITSVAVQLVQSDDGRKWMLGSVEVIVDQLLERRARLDISYIMVFANVMDAFAAIVARLAGK